MFKVICKIFFIFLLLLPSWVIAEENWGIYFTGTNRDEITSGVANINSKTDMIPVGISYNDNKIYFMFIKDPSLNATNYWIDFIDYNSSSAQIEGAIQKKVNEGWVPFDLTYTQSEILVLYLKCSVVLQEWLIVPCQNNWESIQKTVSQQKGFFPLGMSFDKTNAYLLLIRAESKVSEWLIKNCGENNPAINASINKSIKEGYTPYGFEYKGNQVGAVFLK
ncbi:MAG: hypothetical protein HQK76_14195 [Desulfobacterales bacterium]|nr:hypothetical protein [Desulfobacterales bacterium]